MGSGASHSYLSSESPEVLAERYYPSFFIPGAVVEKEDVRIAKSAWTAIVDDESPKYLELRNSGQCPATSCLTWFYDTFYKLSEERDKDSMLLYGNGLKAQIKALVGMINMSVNLFQSDMAKITQTLAKVAKGHVVHIGVRAYQFPIVTEILLDCFKICLGDSWDEVTDHAWKKMLSCLLTIMLPAVIREEQSLTEEQKQSLEAAKQEKLEATQNSTSFDTGRFNTSRQASESQETASASTASAAVEAALQPASPRPNGNAVAQVAESGANVSQAQEDVSGETGSTDASQGAGSAVVDIVANGQ